MIAKGERMCSALRVTGLVSCLRSNTRLLQNSTNDMDRRLARRHMTEHRELVLIRWLRLMAMSGAQSYSTS